MNDTTSPRDMATRLREYEALLRASFDEAPVGMGHLGADGRWLRMNRRLMALLGLDASGWKGRSLVEMTHPDDAPALEVGVRELLGEGNSRMDTEARLHCGQVHARFHLSLAAVRTAEGEPLITCVAEPAARPIELRYLSAIADSSHDAFIGQDADGIVVQWNLGAQRNYGYRPDEIIGQPFFRLVPDACQGEIAALIERIRRDARSEHHRTEGVRKDGGRIQVALTFSPVFDQHAHVIGTSIIGRDITGEVKTLEEMQRAADLLNKIFSGIRILLAYMDRDFNFIKVNRAYAAADRREPEDFVGKNHFDLYPNAENEAMFRLAVETGEPVFVAERPFVYAAHPERGVSYWDWVLQPVRGANGSVEGVLLSIQDVTER
ncbi:MAG: PAS domain-containing protein, partial [Thiohalomonadaceae bacterium]